MLIWRDRWRKDEEPDDRWGGGEELKEEGLARTERSNKEWIRWIRGEVIRIAQAKGTVNSDDLRRVADAYDRQPASSAAWGAVFRGERWVLVGITKSRYSTNHYRRIYEWKLAW